MQMLDYANEKKIPVWAPVTLLDWLLAKDEARFTNIQWLNNHLSFTIESSLKHANGITCLIPYLYNGKKVNEIS